MTLSMVQLARDIEQWRAIADPDARLKEWLADTGKHVAAVIWALEDARVTPVVQQHRKLGGWYRTTRALLDVQTIDREVIRRLRGLPSGLRQWILWQWSRTDRPASFWKSLFQHEEVLRWLYQWAQTSSEWRVWTHQYLDHMPEHRLQRKLAQLVQELPELPETPEDVRPVSDTAVYAVYPFTGKYYWFLFYTLPFRQDWMVFCIETLADLRVERALTITIPEGARHIVLTGVEKHGTLKDALIALSIFGARENQWFFPVELWLGDAPVFLYYAAVARERAYMWIQNAVQQTPQEQWPVRLRAYYERLLQPELERAASPEIQKVRSVLERQTVPLHTPRLAFTSHKAVWIFLQHLYALMTAYRSAVDAERFVDWVADITRDQKKDPILDSWLDMHRGQVVAPSPPALDDALRRAFAKAYLLSDPQPVDVHVLETVEWIVNWTLVDMQEWFQSLQE